MRQLKDILKCSSITLFPVLKDTYSIFVKKISRRSKRVKTIQYFSLFVKQ